MSVPDKILIVDYGGQYAHLISRRVRDLGVLCEILPHDSIHVDKLAGVKGIILSGGPRSVGVNDSFRLADVLIPLIDNPEIPVLGICYGLQLIGHYYGGSVTAADRKEYGNTTVELIEDSLLIDNKKKFNVWMSHGDQISHIESGFIVTARSDNCPVVAMENSEKNIFAVQFHPEVTHTEGGNAILGKFVNDICNIKVSNWQMENYLEILIEEIRNEVGSSKVLLGVSGGVDSTTAALILAEAIGPQLYLIFVDHGLLRKNEALEVKQAFTELGIPNFNFVDASEIFLSKLNNITDPEEKRKIIGHTFIEVFEEAAVNISKTVGSIEYLAQGTIYPDRVESGKAGTGTEVIKSHHNLTLPDNMTLKILEPLKDLYKDEVRQLGMLLNMPSILLNRFPFPGPGLAVRILGNITRQQIQILQEADHIFLTELLNSPERDKVWQAFAALLPVKSVGVKGDNRSYGQIVALRAVASKDGMTADFSQLSMNLLGRISTKIINEIPEITRVLYDISTKPPATIEFE
ncbi:MAG: glutamine-hydrolyzing GMP synthase [Candidatus Heimdallarchaeota archaeon]|nr:glutamine-hydrolyzing GMP synthase [Candidatus Heimdallarchaeota archaeon]MDH5645801.1 glutamine-hydrolyzing GMP synthase [Candidatus Heimdallarchaeota archaeon]